MSSRSVNPLGNGTGTWVSPTRIVATFPLGQDMTGFYMSEVSLDETGYFLTIAWQKEDPDGSEPLPPPAEGS